MTDFEKRIAAISAKRIALNDAEAIKKQQEEDRTNELIGKIIAMGDRIAMLIEVGNHLLKNGLFPHEKDVGLCGFHAVLEKYGYTGTFHASGICHHVGFMVKHDWQGVRQNQTIRYIGIQNGGANGKWDFYTDGTEVFHMHEWDYGHQYENRPTKRPSIYDLEKFVSEFPKFESAVYAWIDSEMTHEINIKTDNVCGFLSDDEKMHDFFILTKEEFLESYSYLTEEEYEKTVKDILKHINNREV